MDDNLSIVLFDGPCPLCNRMIGWIARRDRRKRFRFAALGSPAGARLLATHPHPEPLPESVLLIADGRTRERSDAAIGIAEHLGLPWSLACVFRLVPRRARDAAYDAVARRRNRLARSCPTPGPEIRERLLPDGAPAYP